MSETATEKTFALEISFGGVGVNISREAHRRLVDAVDLICAEYEARHPECVMWPAGFGAKMLCHPLALSDDEPIPFDDSVETIECCVRERFDDEEPHFHRDPVAALQDALVAHNDALRSAYAVAKRDGEGTNWDGLKVTLGRVLKDGHRASNEAREAAKARGSTTTRGDPHNSKTEGSDHAQG